MVRHALLQGWKISMCKNNDKILNEALQEIESAEGHLHGHIHEQIQPHAHLHIHEQTNPKIHLAPVHGQQGMAHQPESGEYSSFPHFKPNSAQEVVTIRSHSGLSGDMLFTGFALLNLYKQGIEPGTTGGQAWLNQLCADIMPALSGCASLSRIERAGIHGWGLRVELPVAHEHRNLEDMRRIAEEGQLSEEARELGMTAFELLAKCEAEVHNRPIEKVHFHEVGALDSILDIFGVCELYCRLGSPLLTSAPLPIADGQITCAHGIIPAPAPATLKLMEGLPVRPFEGSAYAGELLTPTALTLVHVLKIAFGPWPACVIKDTALVYGQKVFSGAPNGVIFALGKKCQELWTFL